MLKNAEITTVREDFGERLQALAAYIEAPGTFDEPLFYDDEVAIVNTLLSGDADVDGLGGLRDLAKARTERTEWTPERLAEIIDSNEIPEALAKDLGL